MQRIKPEFQSFGAEVRRLRKSAGLNQQRLADLVNVTRSYIHYEIEAGRTRCRRETALRVLIRPQHSQPGVSGQ